MFRSEVREIGYEEQIVEQLDCASFMLRAIYLRVPIVDVGIGYDALWSGTELLEILGL